MDIQKAVDRPMGPPTIKAADSTLFFSPDQVVSMNLPAEGRFVAFIRGESPKIIPINDPGTYEIDCATLENGEWPVMVSVLPLDRVGLFQKMTPEHVKRILDRALAEARSVKRNTLEGEDDD